ncbi:MAG: hypothetical protein U0838_08330 [Chloroflexota bacterium]
MFSRHAANDPLLVAAHAAGDASGADLARAAALVASCAECAALHRDLRALPRALASAPAPARPRDFRLTGADAAALARPSGWRRLLAPLSGARSASGPLAASLAALGVAGLLLGGGVHIGMGGGSASAPVVPSPGASEMAVTGGAGATPDIGPKTQGSSADPRPSAAPSAAASAAPSAAYDTPIDRGRAIEIARGARLAYATAPVIEAAVGTFDDLGNAGVETVGPEPGPDAVVWIVNLGKELGPRSAAGAIVVIDARDGHVIQAFDWIS